MWPGGLTLTDINPSTLGPHSIDFNQPCPDPGSTRKKEAMKHSLLSLLLLTTLPFISGGHWCYYQSQDECEEHCDGPSKWHTVYANCGGEKQSPINIVTRKTESHPTLKPFTFEGYDRAQDVLVKNNGHSVQTALPPGMRIMGAGLADVYKAVQFHLHWGSDGEAGSEHTIDGERYPMEVALYREPDTRVTCGGTIVSRDWVVSAGHCFFGPYRDPLKWKVALGLVDTAVPEHWAQRSGVDKLYVHEQFFNPDNDIALLHLSSPAEFNDYVRPACLPCTGTSNADEWSNCYVTGFGLFSETGAQGVVLQQAGMKLIPPDECKSKEMYGAYVNDNMVCAGFAGGVEDTCQVNSGGPLVCKLKGGSGAFRLVGAVSWARGCANPDKPGVYSSVSRYVEWIANTTGVAAEVLQGETTTLMCH
ncbi:UNVERIFIED_CONTAM: hypothetical protein FKN15_041374 [Acipenser sinensis]